MSSWILFPVCHIHNYHSFGIPARPKPAKTLLCHRSPGRPGISAPVSCVLRAPLLFPPGDRSAEQLYKAEHPIPALLRSPTSFKIALRPSEMVSLCLPAPGRAPPHRPSAERTREETECMGGTGELDGCFASRVCLSLPLSLPRLPFSPVLLFGASLFPTSFLHSSPDPDLPVMPSHSLPPQKEREECERLAGLQAIVPRGPAEHCRATLWFLLLFFSPILLLFTIVAGTIE